jgi:mannose-6-phosphate isomerase-like protein (cupin superfamily)
MASGVFEYSDLLGRQRRSGKMYLEFLRVPALSAGLYRIHPGGTDPQKPHREDEVYYVISGQATIRIGAEDKPVSSGSVIFVEAGVEHRFHSVMEDLRVLVFFAPAETEA